jgi:hypothetical protein
MPKPHFKDIAKQAVKKTINNVTDHVHNAATQVSELKQ